MSYKCFGLTIEIKKKKIVSTHLFLAMLSFHCCRGFSGFSEQGLLPSSVFRLPVKVAFVAVHRL